MVNGDGRPRRNRIAAAAYADYVIMENAERELVPSHRSMPRWIPID